MAFPLAGGGVVLASTGTARCAPRVLEGESEAESEGGCVCEEGGGGADRVLEAARSRDADVTDEAAAGGGAKLSVTPLGSTRFGGGRIAWSPARMRMIACCTAVDQPAMSEASPERTSS